MLTAKEAATIRAALRFWMDEVIPAGQETASHYFDDRSTELMSRSGTEVLAKKFDLSSLRYIEADNKHVRLRDLDEVDSSSKRRYHAVVVSEQATQDG